MRNLMMALAFSGAAWLLSFPGLVWPASGPRLGYIPEQNSQRSLSETVFYLEAEKLERAALENVSRSLLQDFEGVKYVGVDYRTREIVVRYDTSRISLKALESALQRMAVGRYHLKGTVRVDPRPRLEGLHNQLQFQCLEHDMARELCETHFQGKLPEDLDLENCYVIKVDSSEKAAGYDWLANAALIDSQGKAVTPITWLELPEAQSPARPSFGLLIFPKIPAVGMGLTLRLLRVNGEGYDSFDVDLPRLP